MQINWRKRQLTLKVGWMLCVKGKTMESFLEWISNTYDTLHNMELRNCSQVI